MGDDDRVGTAVELVSDGLGQLLPVGDGHVLGEDGEEYVRLEVGDLLDLGDRVDHVRGGKGGVHGTGPVVHVGGDGTSGSDEDDGLETLLGLLGGLGLHPFHRPGDDLDFGRFVETDTDVVSALHLHDQDILAAELVMGHEDTLVGLASNGDVEHASLVRSGIGQFLRKEVSIHNARIMSLLSYKVHVRVCG